MGEGMLSQAQSDLLTRTGPGTPGGRFMRSYWQPIAASQEMPIGGDPLPIRILSEDLVLFRDDKDRLGLIERNCPHRGTDLSYGRVEDGGLRCLYHGWVFDIHGKCIEQPGERRPFCDKVPMVSYPVQEKGGAIWAYMGEGEPPLIPDYEFLIAPEPNRWTYRSIQMCNWLQGLESSIDPLHTTYLHRLPLGQKSIRSGNDVRGLRGSEPPYVSSEATNFGRRIYALHESEGGKKYLRVNNFAFPCAAMPSTGTGGKGYQGRFYVPIDDYSHCTFEFIYRHNEPLDKPALLKFREANVGPDKRYIRREENRYLQDREELKSNRSFSGMGDYFPAHDAFAIETQGSIRNRMKENLGASDVVITAITRMLLNGVQDVQDGKDAPGLVRSNPEDFLKDFLCIEAPIEPHEDGPAYVKRALAERAAQK
ncbi:MAG: phthalate 4,5-dioxygenase [Alphaproteobacteria bacterium]|nr:phthalate 4,5-dioxygenase [Alphaproteobacteria bacterium]